MASDLATRTPLMQKQHTADANATTTNPTQYSSKLSSGSPQVRTEQTALDGDFHQTAYSGLAFAYNPGFRYQIRRPVESWKFLETRKQDGSVLYLCRVCNSSYKHKKSLNKHWKDKHSDHPRPEGAQLEDDDEEDDEDESDDEPHSMGTTGVTSEVENIENIPPSWGRNLRKIELNPSMVTGSVLTSTPTMTCVRRCSLPSKRSVNRQLHTGRMSLVPTSEGKFNRSNLLPLDQMKRKRTLPLMPDCDTPEATRSKRLSIDLAASSQFHYKEFTKTNTMGAPKFDNDPFHPYTKDQGSSNFPQDEPILQDLSRGETQPLDLTVLKQFSESNNTAAIQDDKPLPVREKSNKAVDISLLIGLLQAALNTLNSELRNNPSNDELANTTNNLSKTSTSLLFAIGTLLVTLVDETKRNSPKSPGLSVEQKDVVTRDTIEEKLISSTVTESISENLGAISQTPNRISPVEMFPAQYAEGYTQMASDSQFLHNMEQLHGLKYFNEMNLRFPLNLAQNMLFAGQFNASSGKSIPDNTMQMVPLSSTPPEFREKHGQPIPPNDRTHTANTTVEHTPETSIACPVCKFDARWFSELRAHMVNHSAHRMFGCCYCPYRAKWKWDVAKHMRRCPLGRHVAHLSNEALLRIVRYHPPPPGDILHSYFPQDVFPGVGIDRPPTPPESKYIDRENHVFTNPQQTVTPTNGNLGYSQTPAPPTYVRYTSSVSNEDKILPSIHPPILHRQDISPDPNVDDSPKALIIVDGDDEQSSTQSGCHQQSANDEFKRFSPELREASKWKAADKSYGQEIETKSLVFRLRKCTPTTEQDYTRHEVIHE